MRRVSIIICTRDRADSLRRTLAAMGAVDVPPSLVAELIVVDNGSRDDTAEAVRTMSLASMPVKYVFEPAAGKAGALNRGMAEAAGDILVFTDDDVIPPREWLAGVCAPILAGTAEAVAGGIRLAPHLVRPWMESRNRGWVSGTTDSLDPGNPSRMLGANMAFSRAVLGKVPAFDPELGPGALGFGEDTLFTLQLREAGYRVAGAFEAPVEHHFSEDRLEVRHRLEGARKLGRVDAYLAYHWEHSRWPRPRARLLTAWLRWVWWSVAMRLRGGHEDPVPERYLEVTRSMHACVQYLKERTRPRNYDRHGLRRLNPTGPLDKAALKRV